LGERSGFSESTTGQETGRLQEDSMKSLKTNLPENTLFNINSLIFKLQNNKEELVNKYNCFYNPGLEALCIIVEDVTKYSDLSKDIILNLMSFAQKLSIKNLILLLDRKNKDYVKILQGMMTVGFKHDTIMKTSKLGEKEYKVLKMVMKTVSDDIEEIPF
jgi:hypothetical protein